MNKKLIKNISITVCSILLFCGCGLKKKSQEEAVKDAYRTYATALHAGDFETLKKNCTATRRAELDKPDASLMTQMARAFRPVGFRITKVSIEETDAFLEMAGALQGREMFGAAKMVCESDVWKLAEETWSIVLTSDDAEHANIAPVPDPPVPTEKHHPQSPVEQSGYIGMTAFEIRERLGWPPITYKKSTFEYYRYPDKKLELIIYKNKVIGEETFSQ